MNRIPREFKVSLPEERTAQYPAEARDESRLLVVDHSSGSVKNAGSFRSITEYITSDLLVINDTRVLRARVDGRRPGGGRLDLLFLTVEDEKVGLEGEVEALIKPGRRLRAGLEVSLPEDAIFRLEEKNDDGRWRGTWTTGPGCVTFHSWLERVGHPPLPPYIRRPDEEIDCERYQTVYAGDARSVAAPTAGFHFTRELMWELEAGGCDIVKLSLDIGLGTFLPIRSRKLEDHRMHEERYYISPQTASMIASSIQSGRNITVVGTTVVRALEDAACKGMPLKTGDGIANIFIYPPFRFQVVDRLLTNFHRPDSTLLQLVAALIGWDLVNLAYMTALKEGFRFFSYGDAMLII